MSLEVRDSIIHGKGVFTTAHIPKHSVICRVNIVRRSRMRTRWTQSKAN